MKNRSKNRLLPIYLRREKKESLLKSSNLETNPLTNLRKIWSKIKVFNNSKKMNHSKEQHKNLPHHRSFLRSLRTKQACKSTLRYSSRIDWCLEWTIWSAHVYRHAKIAWKTSQSCVREFYRLQMLQTCSKLSSKDKTWTVCIEMEVSSISRWKTTNWCYWMAP